MNTSRLILAINPGSTSTKIAVFQESDLLFSVNLGHSTEELACFSTIWDQYEFRKNALLKTLEERQVKPKDIRVIACRGGNFKPIEGGIYEINEAILRDSRSGIYGVHPCNVGCRIGYDLGQEWSIPVVIVDPPVTDEMMAEAKYTGLPQIVRQSSFHALNQKATARKLAAKIGKSYETANFIICHLGGGISVGAHYHGRVIDVNNALNGDGPFAPERAGDLPTGDFARLCFSGKYSYEEVAKMLTGKGGLVAYLGTADALTILGMIEAGDEKAKAVWEAMWYQVCKQIGSMAVALHYKGGVGCLIDAIGLTGSLARSQEVVDFITKSCSWLAPVLLWPGENEIEALGAGALRYLNKEEAPKLYS